MARRELLSVTWLPGVGGPLISFFRIDMAPRVQPSLIKNKVKRQEVAAKQKKAKNQQKLQKRLARAKEEANDPAAKKVCTIVPHTTN